MSASKLQQTISNVIFEAQEKMPIGQSWNLYSKSACDSLAEKIAHELDTAEREDSITASE